jgi:signal transduction histidine kinase
VAHAGAVARFVSDYRLTAAFLVISAIVFFSAAQVITSIAGKSAEDNTVMMIQDQSERDALIFARLASRAISGDLTDVASADAGRVAAELLDASDVLRISLYDEAGEEIWSSGRAGWSRAASERSGLADALAGETNTVVLKGIDVADMNRPAAAANVIESFVPLVDGATGETVLVLASARDVTETLAGQIALTRTELYRSILTTMAAGFSILFLMVAMIDVSLRRSREREMRQGMTMARMDIVNSELERSNRERNRFVAMISHELKTPLTSILAFSEILGRRLGRSDDHRREGEFVEVIRRNSTHLQRLISDLLDASRLQAGQLSIEPHDFEVAGMVNEAATSIQPLLSAKGQKLRTGIDVANFVGRADRGRLLQVVTNLLTNASKYTPSGSIVKLTASMTDNVLAVSVKDNGPGIPLDQQADLFRPFYRVDNAETRAQAGTGLGLAIVKAIVEGHGGVVDLRSEPGFGTEVSLRLPVGVPAVEIEPEPRDVPLTAALDLQPVIDVSAAIRRLRVGA